MRRPFSAFTLLELLLVLALLSAIVAVTVPNLGLLLGEQRLTRAAEQLRIELTRLRVDAMRSGEIMILQAEVDSGILTKKPFFSGIDSVDSNKSGASSQSALLSGGNQATVTAAAILDPESEEAIELPDEVTVQSIAVAATARSAMIQQQVVSATADLSVSPVLFYCDGTTSNAVFTLTHPTIGQIVVKLRGITGDVSIGEATQP